MAARVIAQLIIKGSTILAKAFVTAYQQALNSMRALTIYFYLLMELCTGGELYQYLKTKNRLRFLEKNSQFVLFHLFFL